MLLKKNSTWHKAHHLKKMMTSLLQDACQQLKQSPNKSSKSYSKINSKQNIDEKIAYFLQKGEKSSQSSSITNSCATSTFFTPVKFACATAMSAFTAISQLGYFCSTKTFFAPYIKETSWGVSAAIMTPVTFFASLLGFKGLTFLFDNLRALANGKKTSLPFSLRAYPKTTLALAILMLFISAFGWADEIETFRATCPVFLKEVFENIIYFSAGTFNALLCLQFIENLVKKLASFATGDHEIATRLIHLTENLINIINNSSNEQFLNMLVSSKSSAIQAFLAQYEKQIYQELIDEPNLSDSNLLKI